MPWSRSFIGTYTHVTGLDPAKIMASCILSDRAGITCVSAVPWRKRMTLLFRAGSAVGCQGNANTLVQRGGSISGDIIRLEKRIDVNVQFSIYLI
ncbi:MAG: hypothetical protein U5L72_11035 [Bacteroidales bacterium]|nr:hypothetical protein [Bacteroidales bacterium]